MQDLDNKLAVVTGAGSGIGRALAQQLTAAGCHVALCDLSMENLEETRALCNGSVRISLHHCDVALESQVVEFASEVTKAHASDHINLLFNNAGVAGGGSFLTDDRAQWDKTFGVCWGGVYHCARAFMPLLVASDAGHIINISSVNGFWACMGPHYAHTAYSAAKFAVKGFSEALLVDLRLNAPHVNVSVVMPGHIGTSIVINSARDQGIKSALEMDAEEVEALRRQWAAMEPQAAELGDDDIRQLAHNRQFEFRDNAPTTAAQAAEIILAGVHDNQWRILVGDDARALDEMVRANPESAYETDFFSKMQSAGIFSGAGI